MNEELTKLNCMNYHVADSNNDYWYACNGLRSLYQYSKVSNMSFKELCTGMIHKGEVILQDTRDNDNDVLILTMV